MSGKEFTGAMLTRSVSVLILRVSMAFKSLIIPLDSFFVVGDGPFETGLSTQSELPL